MKLEEQRNKLLKCETSKDFHDLYKKVFGEEFPETMERDPAKVIEDIANAVYINKKVKEVPLNGALI